MLARRTVWNALDGLDERFFFFEETDFCLRIRGKRLRVTHLPQIRVWRGHGQTTKQVSAAARIEYWRSRYRYFAKHLFRRGQSAPVAGRAVVAFARGLADRVLADGSDAGKESALEFAAEGVFGAGRLAYALLSSRCGPASLKNKNEKIFPRREISTAHGVQMLFGGGPSDREKRHSVSFAW